MWSLRPLTKQISVESTCIYYQTNTGRSKQGQGIFLQDAIETSVPGVIMNRRTVSGGQQFNIRGYGNGARGTNGVNSNFDGQGYKVYVIEHIPLLRMQKE